MEMKEIVIVQGDNYNLEIELENMELDIEINIFFTCEKLGLCKKLYYDEIYKSYVLSLLPSETKDLPKGIYDYDLTIKLSNSIKTFQYKSTIVILEKNNKVVCYG